MTIILSWNIQNGKGCDGETSFERIASVIRDMAEPDVICLQEVSRHMAFFPGGPAPDHAATLSALFPGYALVYGPSLEVSHGGDTLARFGNATLSRLPVLSVFRHMLPQPAASGTRHMPRQATEVTVETAGGALRILNTHLEYHSSAQRLAQINRLRALQSETVDNAAAPPVADADGAYKAFARPARAVFCGDFNMPPESAEYDAMLSPLPGEPKPFHDAWPIAHKAAAHAPTCGIFDHDQWPQGPHARDYFFVTPDLAKNIKNVSVNTQTDASDHQPLMLELDLA